MNPSVSIIIPAYNAAVSIARVVACLRAQSFPDWEAILVDDGSTDATAGLVPALCGEDRRFRMIRQENAGVSSARNTGVAAASAMLAVFLDADDELEPSHLGTLIAAHRSSRADIVYCGYREVSPLGTTSGPIFSSELARRPYHTLSRHCSVAIHGVMVPVELVRRMGGFDPSLATCEDWDLWIRVARAGAGFVGVAEPLALYHRSPASLSSNRRLAFEDGLRVLDRAVAPDPRLPAGHCARTGDAPFSHEMAIVSHVYWHACREALADGATDPYVQRAPSCHLPGDAAAALADQTFWTMFSHVQYCYARVSQCWKDNRAAVLSLFAKLAEVARFGEHAPFEILVATLIDQRLAAVYQRGRPSPAP